MTQRFFCLSLLLAAVLNLSAERTSLNGTWRFAFGNAVSPELDYGCGTEYFNFFTKCASIHNAGPYSMKFDDSAWDTVCVPHDWATTLPYNATASHSHGYHCLGYHYPEQSVGWYRRTFTADSAMLAGPARIVFDGIFRNSRVWVNGFYLGHEESGYTRQTYDITDFLNPGNNNIVCVRADASLEEGWFYEGAGIYRNVWIEIGEPTTPVTSPETARYTWSVDSGFMVDGRKVELHGVNLHQDHAGVGAAIPKGLWEYRLRKMMDMGVNAIRCSHNPASEDFLDLCDSLGLYVIEETRLMGSNADQRHVLETMIRRDMHHRCIILWSVGNEEWGIEWTDKGEKIARRMTEWVHEIDPSRPSTVATSSGPNIVRGVDVAGYNYIMQNDVDGEHLRFPSRIALGSEETTGCGTRGIYFTDAAAGHMAAINRTDSAYENVIERGWKFYFERPWLAGLFYWTGFDYLGEANPLVWPAVGSEFGILDACGFPKDEAFYLQAWWTSKPTIHILPHWNLQGHEGDTIPVWVYSNAEEVELRINGKSLGRQPMPLNGHLAWKAIYQPGKVEAIGYVNGKKAMREVVFTNAKSATIMQTLSTYDDITIADFTILDAKGHYAVTACDEISVTISGSGNIIGFGNGDPAFKQPMSAQYERKSANFSAFNGHAQVVIKGQVNSVSATFVRQ